MGILAMVTSLYGQEAFTFQNKLGDTVRFEIDRNAIGSHYLGDEMAMKYYRFEETYTYVEPGSITNPTQRTVITKPIIYYSLKKLNSHYKKQLKKGRIDSSEAVKKLGWYFDVGFAIYEQDTSELEKALKSAKKPDEIAQVFAHVTLE